MTGETGRKIDPAPQIDRLASKLQKALPSSAAALVRRGTVILPANVHYAWPHAPGCYLYVAFSDSTPGVGAAGDKDHVTAFHIDPASGKLTPHGDPIPLPTRPIHMTTDNPSDHLMVVLSNPSAIRVDRFNPDANSR